MTSALSGKRVFVTGASSGIGADAARRFAAEGAVVALASEQEMELGAVVRSILDAGGQAMAFVADFSRPEQVEGLIARVEQSIGPLDVLVNNAGIGLGAQVLDTDIDDMRHLFEINFFALAQLSKQALAVMSQRHSGRIINVSSAAGRFGSPNISAYSASKGAVHAFTQALRFEARVGGIDVSEVLPISVQTKFFENAKGNAYQPRGVVLTTEAVAQCIVNCAAARRPSAEVLPYRGIRALFVANAVVPEFLIKMFGRRYSMHLSRRRAETGTRP